MTTSDLAYAAMKQVCRRDCWENPATECPYFDICTSEEFDAIPDYQERLDMFESAVVLRWAEIHGIVKA